MKAQEARAITEKSLWEIHKMNELMKFIQIAAVAGKYSVEVDELDPWVVSSLYDLDYRVHTNTFTHISIISWKTIPTDDGYI